MEIIFKLTITFIAGALIYYQIFFLKSVWEKPVGSKGNCHADRRIDEA